MLNTLPFRRQDFDNAREKVFGQHIESLVSVVDVFEVMTYHQILRQPTSWIPKVGMEVKKRSGRKTFCTIQTTPLYLEDIYASGKRSTTLGVDEFRDAVDAVKESDLDGVVVFTWSDLLQEVNSQGDRSKVEILRKAVQ